MPANHVQARPQWKTRGAALAARTVGWWSWLGWEVNHVKPAGNSATFRLYVCFTFFSLSHLQTTILSCLITIQVCLKIGGTPYLWPCEIAESDDKRWGSPISQFLETAHEGRPVHHAMNRFCWFVMDLWFVFFFPPNHLHMGMG